MRREAEENQYRNYVTEALRILTENTTHHVLPGYGNVGYGGYLKSSWAELRRPRREKEEPENGDAIALDLMRRAGLTFGEKTNGGSI